MDALRSAWEAFHGGESRSLSTVRPAILASWRRSRELAVSPDLRVACCEAGPNGPAAELVARAGGEVARELAADLAGSGCVVVLADGRGTILARFGDREQTVRTDPARFVPGASWTEAAAGTNALGLALALGRPVHVRAAEHFCVGWHPYGCTAALVRHPLTRGILGTLVITTPAAVHDAGVVGALAKRTAGAIEHELERRLLGPGRALVDRHARLASDRPQLTIDAAGRMLVENPAAARGLTPEERAAVLDAARRALAAPSDLEEAVGGARVHVALVRVEDEIVGATVRVELGAARRARTLREIERDAIVRALAESDGSVDAAADALGVSRATLYRRLRSYRALGRPA